MWLWTRALVYILIVGGGWLIILPTCVLLWEHAGDWPAARSDIWVVSGLVVFVLGAALAIWAGYYLIGYGHGTPLPVDPPRRLVTEGPYRFVRNPQAIAMVLMVLGELLIIESTWLWVMLPLTIAYLEVLVGPIEVWQGVRGDVKWSLFDSAATNLRR